MTRAGLRAAAALLIVTAAAACGKTASSSSSPPPPKSSSLTVLTPAPTGSYPSPITWGLYREVSSLDPIIAFDYPENTVISTLCDTLLRQSPDGVVGPGLGTLTYPDPTTLSIAIHPGATFWDGHPVTADDVVYSLDRQRDPKLGGFYGQVFTRVKSITATDPSTVTIKLTQPDYWFFPETLAALEGRALRTDALAAELDCDRRRLFKPGALKELREHGLVRHDPRLGYYAANTPPPELSEE